MISQLRNSPIISVSKARVRLGDKSNDMSDEDILDLLEHLESIAGLLIKHFEGSKNLYD